MNTISEQDVRLLVLEAAASFPVPAYDAVLAAADEVPPAVPLHRQRWPRIAAAAAVVAGALVLSASLTGGSPPAEQVAGPAPAAASAPAPSALASAAPETTADRRDSVAESYDPQAGGLRLDAQSGRSTELSAQGAPGPAAKAPVTAPAPSDQLGRVVKTGEVSLIAEDGGVSSTLTAVQRAAQRVGGIVAGSATNEAGKTPSGTVTVRVPVARFEALVLEVRGLGTVRTAATTAKDVTAEYADLETQIRTLTAARERFLRILTQAGSVGEILSVQQRVDDVTGKIDRLQGTRKVLAAQSDLSTLAVTVTEADDPAVVVAPEEPDTGLSAALTSAKDGFVGGVEALVAGSGRALLVLLCLGALAVVGRLAWRTGRRRLV